MTRRVVSLWRLLQAYWTLLLTAFVAMLVAGAADLLEPWPLKIVFDHVIGSKPPPRWLAIWVHNDGQRLAVLSVAAAAVVAIALIGAVSSYTQKYLSTTVGKRVGFDLRHMLYHHIQRLSLAFYETRRTGDMVVRLTSDIDAAEDFITNAVLGIVLDLLTLVGMVVVMFAMDWQFSLIALSIAPLLFALIFHYTRRIKAATRAVKRKESELASVVQESIASARIVKTFAREDFEEQRLDRESQESVALSLQARGIKAVLAPLVDVIVAVGTGLVLWFGARLVIRGGLTSGALLVFLLYLAKMYKPMKDLSKMTDTLSKAAIAFERVGEIMAIEGIVRDVPGAVPAPRFAGRITFAHVQFGYNPETLVLRDVDLEIEPGQRAALVGLTGCGKSTLLGLIPRLYDVGGGEVRIDDRDVRHYTLGSLRERVSVVLQDPVLFRATIAENIAYGRHGSTAKDVLRAAKLAHVDEFVARLPLGYETIVGERGETLSGGQRQRITIARAIVRDAPILLLDEPSASLDPESEELIFAGLSRLMRNRTSITIAHRLATVRSADVIFVLHDGVIAERGTHHQLLAANHLYARLYRMQFRAKSTAASHAGGGTGHPSRVHKHGHQAAPRRLLNRHHHAP
jgi:ATP-binding cassette, subfamily B, bacterial